MNIDGGALVGLAAEVAGVSYPGRLLTSKPQKGKIRDD